MNEPVLTIIAIVCLWIGTFAVMLIYSWWWRREIRSNVERHFKDK